MRIVFAGTPDFAAVVLSGLLADSSHEVVAVYCQPDRRSGRGQKITVSPTKAVAQEAGIPVEQPVNFKDPAEAHTLAAYAADVIVVAAYGLLLPTGILNTPRLGCINVHASRLPRWRGAAPIQRAILAGDTETGVSIMQMDAGLDTGDVLAMTHCPIAANDTAQSIHDRLATQGIEALGQVLVELAAGTATATAQPATGSTYASRIEKAEAEIDWSKSATDIDRLVRAFNPFPIAYSHLGERRTRIWRAEVVPVRRPGTVDVGTIVDVNAQGMTVSTGDGDLLVTQLQFSGGKALPVSAMLNAGTLRVGDRFR
ncbi:MAG: methionyl-tRNA formyltransferase [Gammaproteobacteria bacterium]|nr:methionyl-tRNA formyltransferase [Gammaproteobacteria bacterium]